MDISSYFYKNIIDIFQQGHEDDSLGGTYIFSGVHGLGKKELVDTIVNNLVSNTEQSFDTHYLSPRAPEDEHNEISIDQVRELTSKIFTTSATGAYKIICIDDAESLTNSSGNALLKVLEDPPKKTLFFLIDNQTSPLLSTIRSRGMQYDFFPFSDEKLSGFLEKNGVQKSRIDTIVSISEGKPSFCLTFSEDETLHTERIAHLQMIADAILSDLFSLDVYFQLVDTEKLPWGEKQKRAYTILEEMKRVLYEALRTKTNRTSLLTVLNREDGAHSHSMKKIIEKLRIIDQAEKSLKKSVPGNIILDSILLNSHTYATY